MRAHPTFILALGELGREVLARLQADLTDTTWQDAVLAFLDLSAPEEEGTEPAELVAQVGQALDTGSDADEGPVARIELQTPLSGRDEERLVGFAKDRAHELLTLDHYLASTGPSDILRPDLSLFLVADLGEPAVRRVLAQVIQLVSQAILERFSHIFSPAVEPDAPPNFGVHPILLLGDIRDVEPAEREDILAALRRLEALSSQSKAWWPAPAEVPCLSRVVLFDDQTPRYVLTREQIVSSLTSFLLLSLHTARAGLRPEDPDWALSRFLRPAAKAEGPFATFGAATLDLARATLASYVRNRLALALVAGARPEEPAEPLGLRLKHLTHVEDIKRALSPRDDDGPLSAEREIEQALEDLAQDLASRCDDIHRSDSPERILNDKYSWPWFEDLSRAFLNRCQDLEERLLPRAAEEIDRAGLKLARAHFQELAEQVDRWVWSEPGGWHRARQYLQELHGQVEAQLAQLAGPVELPPVPEPKEAEQAILGIRELGGRWPRRWRLLLTGGLVVAVLVALFQFLPKWLYLRFVYENTEYVPRPAGLQAEVAEKAGQVAGPLARGVGWHYAEDPNAPEGYVRDTRYDPPSWLDNPMRFRLPPSKRVAHFVVDRPYVLFWLALLFGLLVGLVLERHWRRLEREMAEAVRVARNRLEELARGPKNSARSYFRSRLNFSRNLWIRKLLVRLKDQIEEEIARLNAVDEALVALEHRYRQAQKRLGIRYVGPDERIEDLSGVAGTLSDPIYRRLVRPEMLQEAYARIVENEVARVLEFFEEQRQPPPGSNLPYPDWRENLGFARPEAIDGYVAELVGAHAEDLDPVADLLEAKAEGSEAAARLLDLLVGFFGDLTGKLSHSVELTGPPMEGLTRLLLVPEDLEDPLRERLSELLEAGGVAAALLTGLTVVPTSDRDRITLFVGYAGLRLAQFRLLAQPASGRPAAKPLGGSKAGSKGPVQSAAPQPAEKPKPD